MIVVEMDVSLGTLVANEQAKDAVEVNAHFVELLKAYYFHETITALHLENFRVSKKPDPIVIENEDHHVEQAN